MINAQNVIIADLVCEQILSEDHPLKALEALKKNWLVRGKLPAKLHARVDPVEADLIEQEFRDAVDLLAITIADRIRLHKPLAGS